MNQEFKTKLLENAIEIGDEIIEKAIIDSNGIYWKTVNLITSNDDIDASFNETIHTGVSGILLFYIKLYNITKAEIYLDYVNNSAEWLIAYCKKNPPQQGFYCGRMGAVYTLLKIADLNKKQYYHQKVTEIALQYKEIINTSEPNFNLFDGLAGTIFGLLYLHSETEDEWILDSIYNGIDHLIKNCKSNGTGFYWDDHYLDSTSISTKPLCSMPMGTNGIGLLFLNLSVYFKNPDYQYIADQAFEYERQYLNTAIKNWPDFRINIKGKNVNKLRKSYTKGNYAHFGVINESIDWLYGTIGAGFTKLQLFKILNNEKSNNDFDLILAKISFDDSYDELTNYTLATGKAGMGMLFLELSLLTGNKSYFENACKIATEAINQKKIKKFYQFGFDSKMEYEDDSLLMGNAGIGYFYLNLLETDNPILLPYLNKVSTSSLSHKIYRFNKKQIIDEIIRSWYPHTLNIIYSEKLFESVNLRVETLKDSLNFEILKVIEHTNNCLLKDAYYYELNKQEIQKTVSDNYCFLRFCQETELSKIENLPEYELSGELMSQKLKLNPYVNFHVSKWDWTTGSSNNLNTPGETYILYSLSGKEYILSEISYKVLSSFIKLQKVKYAYKVFIDLSNKNEDSGYLKAVFLNLIKSFVGNGVLMSGNNQLPVLASKKIM